MQAVLDVKSAPCSFHTCSRVSLIAFSSALMSSSPKRRQQSPREVVVTQDSPTGRFAEPRTLFGPAGEVAVFLDDNAAPHASASEPFAVASYGWGDVDLPERLRAAARFEAPPITTEPAAGLPASLLLDVGATPSRRDAVDARIVTDVEAGTGSIIDGPDEVGGYPTLDPGVAPPDADHDGMPDAWELDRGLDPGDGADGAVDDDGDGYTNVEEYLHSLG